MSLGDALAWVSIGAFVLAALVRRRDERAGRVLGALAWTVFGVFWGVLVPHFLFVAKSAVEGVASLLAVPACLYVGYLLLRGRESLFVLTEAVAVAGGVYVPFLTVPVLEEWLIEVVTGQVAVGIDLLGYDPAVETGAEGYRNVFVFEDPDGDGAFETFIVLACTGIGSMVGVAGLIAAIDAPLGRKVRALLVSVPVIWVLNVVRNVFIAVAFGRQWFQFLRGPAQAVFRFDQPGLASFYVADRVISQSLAVVALVVVLWLVARQLPEVLYVIEDVLYVLTRREYDLAGDADLFWLPAPPPRESVGGGHVPGAGSGDGDDAGPGGGAAPGGEGDRTAPGDADLPPDRGSPAESDD